MQMFKKFIILLQKNMSTTKSTAMTSLTKKLKRATPSKHEATKTSSDNNYEPLQEDTKLKKTAAKVKAKAEAANCVIETKKVRNVTNTRNATNVLSTTKKGHTKVESTTSSSVSKIKQDISDLPHSTTNKRSSTDAKDVKKTSMDIKEIHDTKTTLDVFKEDRNLKRTRNEIKVDRVENKWEPKDWTLILNNIRIMRSKDIAPVDTMGCHKCADESADEKTQRFHKLVALMLSSQTKDETTYHAMLRLREHTLTPESMIEMKSNVLENILHPVSFYKNKAKYIQQTSKILIDKYNSDIPDNIKELVALPGVGPKMAHICMATAWYQTTGIGVDVHVHRISNRLKWVPQPTKEPEQTRKALESWLPQDLWKEVNHLFVGFGQTTCTLKPKCSDCLNCDICPAAPKTKSQEKRGHVELMNICDKAKFKKKKMHV